MVKQKMGQRKEKIPHTPGFELQATQSLVSRHSQPPPESLNILGISVEEVESYCTTVGNFN